MRETGQVIKKNEVTEDRDMFSVVPKQERDFDKGRSSEPNKLRIVKTIILNGKKFNVVDFS